jgi:8-oxo-dGTP pyrophosphatase MutT (NUDIX family)
MTPRPASTVVLVRETPDDIETLLLLRNTALAFNGGYWVFPGGKIDQEDYPTPDAPEYEAAMRAVVRETREEAGIEIPAAELIHIAHWTTPPGQSRRYSTWFFVCPLRASPQIVVDDCEILDYCWLSPRLALRAQDQGQLKLPLPTIATLKTLQHYRNLKDMDIALRNIDVHVFPIDSEFYIPPVLI